MVDQDPLEKGKKQVPVVKTWPCSKNLFRGTQLELLFSAGSELSILLSILQ